ncbi:MAG: E3 binding domain-containing protein [Kiritimatiellae bacterium]|nr:E3 binding domain-containing protein [Kiritimatiellia bacterium]
MTYIKIPQLDANILDVTVTKWRKQAGDSVTKGECVAELTTDKAVFELEAPEAGILLAVYAQEKSVVPVGYAVAAVGAAGEAAPEPPAGNETLLAAYRGGTTSAAAAVPAAPREVRVRATPRARRIAAEKGLDLAEIQKATGVSVVDEAAISIFLAQ